MHAFDLDGLVQRIAVAEEAERGLGAEQHDRPVAVDLDGAHHPAALGVEVGEIKVIGRDALDLDTVQHLLAIRHGRGLLCLRHHGSDRRAEAADGIGFRKREERIGANALDVLVRPGDRQSLNRERVRTHLADDGVGNHRVHPLNQRDHRHDRADRDDIPEHRHQRPELVAPDRLKSEADGLEYLQC